MKKIRLNVLGISYSQTQTGAYALVLAEENGQRRIPIIVGGFEAQAIAIQLEGLKPPRPLTHDLFYNFSRTFEIDVVEVMIYKLEEGIFHSKLFCDNGNGVIEIDTRTSDAIALALRFKCPIYTSEDILNSAGIIIDFEGSGNSDVVSKSTEEPKVEPIKNSELTEINLEELSKMLNEAISNEDYEKASEIKKEINSRNNSL